MSWEFEGQGSNLPRRLELLHAFSAPFTAIAWIWPAGELGSANGQFTILNLNAGSSPSFGWKMNIAAVPGFRPFAQMHVTAASGQTFVTSAADQGRYSSWNFLAMVEASATDHRISMNGSPQVTSSTSRTPTGVDRIFVGGAGSGSATQAIPGFVAEVAVWNVALDHLREILPMFLGRRSPRDVARENLLVHWTLRDSVSLTGWRGHRLTIVPSDNGALRHNPSPFHPLNSESKVPLPLFAPQPRIISLVPAVLDLVAPLISVGRTIAPDPVVLSLEMTEVNVRRTIAPDPAVLGLEVPDIEVDRVVAPEPAVLDLEVPDVNVGRTIAPEPAIIQLNLGEIRVNRIILPDPTVLDLVVPDAAVPRIIRPTPAVLNLEVPDITRVGEIIVVPDPAILTLAIPNISIKGLAMPAFILRLQPNNASTKFDGTNALVVFAADEDDARAIAKAEFGGDANAAWDAASIEEIIAGADLEGWRLRVRIFDVSPPLEVEVTAGPGELIDDLGLAMENALNATALIGGASYTAATQVLIVAAGSGADDLGDKTLEVALLPPQSGASPVPGGVVSITDQGLATDDLSATLADDAFTIPIVAARAKI